MVEQKEDYKEFLAPKLDFKIVHYIEKRAKSGHTLDEIRKDLTKGGAKPEVIDKHIDYVHRHKGGVPVHSPWAMVLFALSGVIFISLLIAAVYAVLQ